jgi:hypothetical protein
VDIVPNGDRGTTPDARLVPGHQAQRATSHESSWRHQLSVGLGEGSESGKDTHVQMGLLEQIA